MHRQRSSDVERHLEKEEVIITDLQYEDTGLYECRGHNGKSSLSFHRFGIGQRSVQSIDVRMESDLYWIVKQKDPHVNECDTVNFICNVESKPSPNNIQLFLNGVSLPDPSVRGNPRRQILKNPILIKNVTKLDIPVYQCNVTNIHEDVFANFFVS
jgi:hypothetical protein